MTQTTVNANMYMKPEFFLFAVVLLSVVTWEEEFLLMEYSIMSVVIVRKATE